MQSAFIQHSSKAKNFPTQDSSTDSKFLEQLCVRFIEVKQMQRDAF